VKPVDLDALSALVRRLATTPGDDASTVH